VPEAYTKGAMWRSDPFPIGPFKIVNSVLNVRKLQGDKIILQGFIVNYYFDTFNIYILFII
jgi:hypothetical protein